MNMRTLAAPMGSRTRDLPTRPTSGGGAAGDTKQPNSPGPKPRWEDAQVRPTAAELNPPSADELAVDDCAQGIAMWARLTRVFRTARPRPERPAKYPPRRPDFVADAAMEREMHRL
jgi:hypothetical protein